MTDWRDALLADASALQSTPALRCAVTAALGDAVIVTAWEFSQRGGSFGVEDASAFVAAVDTAIERRLALVSVIRSGGTRLTEGVPALTGIPRAALALRRLAAARLPHLAVADAPTTGGVWVAVGSTADVRLAVREAVVAFSGPRVIEAMTGAPPAAGSGTAEDAYDVGLVDLLVGPDEVVPALANVLAALRADSEPVGLDAAEPAMVGSDVSSWQQVTTTRTVERPSGAALLDHWLAHPIPLRGGDSSVTARLGALAGRPVVAIALAAERGGRPCAAGYRLLTRAARLAGRLDLGLLVLVDTPGADPHDERAGLAPAIADSMLAVLQCSSPTVCLVHGEGGSGGALAGAVTDRVGITEHGWFAPLAPEGAAATLGGTPEQAAETMRLTPAALRAAGFADTVVAAASARAWVAVTLDDLRAQDPARRLLRRTDRWSSAPRPAPGDSSRFN